MCDSFIDINFHFWMEMVTILTVQKNNNEIEYKIIYFFLNMSINC